MYSFTTFHNAALTEGDIVADASGAIAAMLFVLFLSPKQAVKY